MELPNKKYRLIYADPPWTYDNVRTGGSLKSGAVQKYKTLPLQEICDLPISEISNPDAVLFLWSTVPLLPEGLNVLQSWGFIYKTALFWRKTKLGLGFWFRNQVEVLLVGVRGDVKAFRLQKANFIQTKAGKHSEKLKEVYGLLEQIAMKWYLEPKIELFAREHREGWDVWGLEVPDTMQKLL